jgi:peptidyl-prolyl cis-trans isomerase D
MRHAFQNKIAYFILILLFLVIIVSMLFSGFNDNSRMGGPKSVASVDGTPITPQEYQMALQRQLEFFGQMFGGNMTQKQIEEMGIKQQVLNGLIQQKLMLNAAKEIGFVISQEEVKSEIKALPYFKTNDRFDVNLYRNRLQANGYIPAQFEEMMANDLKQKKLDEVFNNTLISENMVQDIIRFKNSKVSVHAVKISRQALAPLITIAEDEIRAFQDNPANQQALETAYSENYAEYNKPAEAKVSHILIQGDDQKAQEKAQAIRSKLNPGNFAQVASRETQDPSGKNKGGELGWISPGQMVPAFEKVAFELNKGQISEPVKTEFGYHLIYVEDKKAAQTKSLESVKPELARTLLQRGKAQDLDQLLKTEEERLSLALERNELATVENLQKRVNGQFHKNIEVNQLDQTLAETTLAPHDAHKLFSAAAGSVVNLGNPGTIHLVKVVSKQLNLPEAVAPEQIKSEMTNQNQLFSRKAREELVKYMNNKAKVVTNPNLI